MAQTKLEDLLAKKLEQLSMTEKNLLEANTEKVQKELQLKATEQSNDSNTEFEESDMSNIDGLFEESDAENDEAVEGEITCEDAAASQVDSKEAATDKDAGKPEDDGYAAELTPEAANKKIDGAGVGEEHKVTESTCKKRSLSNSDVDDARPTRKQRFLLEDPSNADSVPHPCHIPGGSIVPYLRGGNAISQKIPAGLQAHANVDFEFSGMIADSSAIYVLFPNSEKGQEDMGKCFYFVCTALYPDKAEREYCQEVYAAGPHAGYIADDGDLDELDVLEVFKGEKINYISSEMEEFASISEAAKTEDSDSEDVDEDGDSEEDGGEADPVSTPTPTAAESSSESEEE